MAVISRRPRALPAAVLWDMDGTLIDSEPYWAQANAQLVESFGGSWRASDDLLVVGSGLWNAARVLQDRGVELDEDAIVHRLTTHVRQRLRDDGVPWRPGARELLRELRESGVPTALVTMSIGPMASQVVETIAFEAFDVLVTGEMVAEPKPHPEPYLHAAALLGVEPAECIAIEDSLAGLASAIAAGTTTIGVPHMLTLPDTDDYTRWSTLAGRTVADLRELMGADR